VRPSGAPRAFAILGGMRTQGMVPLRNDHAISAAEREANERRLVELVTAPRGGIGVSFGCRLDVLVRSPRRITTGTVVELGGSVVTVEAAPGWETETAIELEIQPEPELGAVIVVSGVIRGVTRTTLRVELDPTPHEDDAHALRRFVLEGIRNRILGD
jgi:hypothetical protein